MAKVRQGTGNRKKIRIDGKKTSNTVRLAGIIGISYAL
jgi:hypothetical protein